MPPAKPHALIADGLTVERGGRTVLAGLSFTAKAGEALVLTGPNGAGKTTLLRTIAGFLAPRAGTLRLDGGADDREIGELSHYIGHLDAVKPRLTVAENAAFWAAYLGGGGAERIEPALERLSLADLGHVPAAYLSAGQKRRLGLARLLLADRPVWLLDEPTVSLDAASRDTLAAIIDAHLAAGGMALAATHLPLGIACSRELRLARLTEAA